MRIKPKVIVRLLKDAFSEWKEDKAMRLGAALSYYTIFSLPPLLVLIVSVAGLVFGTKAVQGSIVHQFEGMLGKEGAGIVQMMIANAAGPKAGITGTIVGSVVLILGATGVFAQLQDALNTIWKVKPKPKCGIKHLLKSRLLSFALVLSIGFLLLVSLVLSAALFAFGEVLNRLLPGPAFIGYILQGANVLLAFGIITLLFAMMFKFLPDAKIAWHDVWLGAAMTALLFTIGKILIGLYLGQGKVGTAFGAAGSLVILLVWFFYSSQILFFGAEFTQVYANRYGSRIRPAEYAVRTTGAERPLPEQEGDGDGKKQGQQEVFK